MKYFNVMNLLFLNLIFSNICLADPAIINIAEINNKNLIESRQNDYKQGKWIYIKTYRLSNGDIIKHCFKIPMKYRTFDQQHIHLRCNKTDYYVN
jgi:hypothetical protein